MRALVRDLLPYGLVTRLAVRRQARREAQRIRERAGMLRQVSGTSMGADGTRLNMGCGTHREPGWINADGAEGAPMRITLKEGEPLPFASATLEVIFSEHFLEHISLSEARWFLREAFRVLKPSGLFRVSCPDLAVIARYITHGEGWQELAQVYETIGDFPAKSLVRPDLVVNHAFYGHGHKHLWTFEALREELEAAGFRAVERKLFGESKVLGAAIEVRRGEAFMSVIAEATKPDR